VQWLQFLECEGLVRWHPEHNKVTITDKGKEFLANRFVSDALLEA
jgi:predicted transcriptional regulator